MSKAKKLLESMGINESSFLSFVDYSNFEPGRGGDTPTFSFSIDGKNIDIEIDNDGDDYNGESLDSVQAIKSFLSERASKLEEELRQVKSFMSKLSNGMTITNQGE